MAERSDNRRNLPLMPSNARRIIEELFAQRPQWRRNELISAVKRIHADRGGVEGNQDPGAIVTKALGQLQEDGKVRNADYSYWQRCGMPTGVGEYKVSTGDGKEQISPPAEQEFGTTVTGLLGDISQPEDDKEEDALRPEKQIGTGPESVYVYFNPNDQKLASLEGRSIWECKIGSTIGEVAGRIETQGIKTALSREPVIGLVIKTDDSAALEKALHNSLRLVETSEIPDKGKGKTGTEWFYTSPELIEKWYTLFQEALRQLKPQAAGG